MTEREIEQEREAFEAWISASGRADMLEREKPHGWYLDLTITAFWTAWQARATLGKSAAMDGEG